MMSLKRYMATSVLLTLPFLICAAQQIRSVVTEAVLNEDGSADITMDREELSLAGWYRRDELSLPADDVSLTNDMIRAFIENRHVR